MMELMAGPNWAVEVSLRVGEKEKLLDLFGFPTWAKIHGLLLGFGFTAGELGYCWSWPAVGP